MPCATAAAKAEAAQDPAVRLLHRPTLIPTNVVIHMKDDPTFAAWEALAAPRGDAPGLPIEFQVISMTVCEGITSRLTDVAAFRRGVLNEQHYLACQRMMAQHRKVATVSARSAGGYAWEPQVCPGTEPSTKQSTTHVRLTGTTVCGRTISVFMRYDLWFYVRIPDDAREKKALDDLVHRAPSILGVDEFTISTTVHHKYPLCGWQPDPSPWLQIRVPNQASKRHLLSLCRKRGFKVVMDRAPMTEELMAVLDTRVRHGARCRVTAGVIQPLDKQVEHVDVEVWNATCECLNWDDDGAPPIATPRRVASWDLEVNDRGGSGGFVDVRREENRVTQASFVVRQLGHPEASGKPGRAETKSEEPPSNNALEAESEPPKPPIVALDLDGVDDEVAAVAATKAMSLGGDHPGDVARIIVSIYDVDPSPKYTVVRVQNEVELFQALRRFMIRLRVGVRLTHYGDGFDEDCQRRKLILHTHRSAVACWFPDHEDAGGAAHLALRKQLQAAARATFLDTWRTEERERSQWRGSGGAAREPHESSMGLWAPSELPALLRTRILLFNTMLLVNDAGWDMRADNPLHGLLVPATIVSTSDADLQTRLQTLGIFDDTGTFLQAVVRDLLAHHEASSGAEWSTGVRNAVLRVRQYIGVLPITNILDAEFLDTDASLPCAFHANANTKKGFYKPPSKTALDTAIVSRAMWKAQPASLNALAARLKVPTKREMPYKRLFALCEQARQAKLAREFPGTRFAHSNNEREDEAGADDTEGRWEDVAEYCVFDAIVPLECEARMGTILEVTMNGWLARTHPSEVYRRGVTWRSFTTIVCRAFPTHVIEIRPDGYQGGFKGAFCLTPTPGFYESQFTSSVDVNSLYPSAIQVGNLCFSSLILDKCHLAAARAAGVEIRSFEFHGKTFHVVQYTKGDPRMREGILPQMMCFLIGARKRVKRRMKNERVPEMYRVLDKQQQALKVAANGTYGALGFPAFKIPAKCLAAATTALGRQVVTEMKRSINEDFPLRRLHAIREEICQSSLVPPRFWDLQPESIGALNMRDLGGDTDSVFWMVPVRPGRKDVLVVLRWTWERQDDGSYASRVEEVPDASSSTSEDVRLAIARFHRRRAKTSRQRKLGQDKLQKMFRAAKARGVPTIQRVVCLTERTITRRIAMALAEHLTQHMVSHCFNQRAALVGRVMLGIGVDYIAERLLLTKKKNYAKLDWEDPTMLEDDDYHASQKGLCCVKADTPEVVSTMYRNMVEALQIHGLDAAKRVVAAGCQRIVDNRVPVRQYAHRVMVKDLSKDSTAVQLFKVLRDRAMRGVLGGVTMPALGDQVPMVKLKLRDTSKLEWEHPGWVEAHPRLCTIDRTYYLTTMRAKIRSINMPQLNDLEVLVEAALRQARTMHAQTLSKAHIMQGIKFRQAKTARKKRLRSQPVKRGGRLQSLAAQMALAKRRRKNKKAHQTQ